MTNVIMLPVQERGPPNLGFGNMTGGFMMGGQAGTLKMTIPTAFTISMLAWSMLEFPQVCAQGSPPAAALPLQAPQHHVIVADPPCKSARRNSAVLLKCTTRRS